MHIALICCHVDWLYNSCQWSIYLSLWILILIITDKIVYFSAFCVVGEWNFAILVQLEMDLIDSQGSFYFLFLSVSFSPFHIFLACPYGKAFSPFHLSLNLQTHNNIYSLRPEGINFVTRNESSRHHVGKTIKV